MSGRYGRTFSRKKAATPPPIDEFDAIVTDNTSHNNRASATKTAGHVGKWGTTVFTSMRQSHFNGGASERDVGGGTKRPAPSESPPLDPYGYAGCGPTNGAAPKPPQQTYKPRKFFKSRNAEPKPEPKEEVCSASKGYKSYSESDKSSKSEKDLNHGKEVSSSPQDSLFDKLVNSSKTNTNSGGNKSGSGIKLKIFKSRNEASSSQDTYSSTVELPSDDSRANSTSNSVSSSPSHNEETIDIPESLTESLTDHRVPRGKNSNSNQSLETTLETKKQLNKESLRVPDHEIGSANISLNSSLDTSVEFMGYINQTTGLAVCDSDSSFNVQKTISEIKPVKRAYGSKVTKPFSKSKELNKILNQNVNTSSVVDSEDLINDSVCSGTLSEDFDPLGVSNSFVETPLDIPPLERSESPVISSGSVESGEDEEHDLFSVDFDENDIQDRTIDDISVPEDEEETKISPTPPNTQEDDDDLLFTMTEASRSTYKTFTRKTPTKSITEVSKNVEKPPAIVKKRSIFKSRNKDTGSGEEKKKATYKHKWHDHDENEDPDKKQGTSSVHQSSSQGSSAGSTFDDFDFDTPAAHLKRVQSKEYSNLDDSMEDPSSVTSVKCAKGAKQYYTVIKNVKRIHQLSEAGEFQEFNDDVEYFLEALCPTQTINTRCLAALNLAQKCMVPSFRMHLRAHGIVIKFFGALSNSPSDFRLAICSAMVMFALSQDRLNMDLDRDSLDLMLNLLDCDETAQLDDNTDAALVKQNRRKIRELCRDMQKRGHAKHLHMDNITAGKLAMETLLSLTSKRAGEWFKEELRELGGMDHLVGTVTQCANLFNPEMETWTKKLLEKLSKADRCLKVLENVTHQNVANQEYLLSVQEGIFSRKIIQMFGTCRIEVPLYPTVDSKTQTSINGTSCGELLAQALITVLKVLVNITHNSHKEAMGSKILGPQDEVWEITLYCLLLLPKYLEHDNAFEVQVLSCCLLLNLIEHSHSNRKKLMSTNAPEMFDDEDDSIFGGRSKPKGALKSLVELFYKSEESSRKQEASADNLIDNDLAKKTNGKDEAKKDEEIEETVTKLLQKAGHHMEDTLVAAYTALLTGYCIMDGEEVEEEIRAMQPDRNYRLMVSVLKKFLEFMNLTATTTLIKSLGPTKRVMKFMEKLDMDPATEAEEERKRQEAKEREFEAFGF